MRQGGPPASGVSGNGSRRPVPTIVFHGDRDTTVTPVNGDQVIAQSKAGADLRPTVNRGQSEGGTTYTRTVQADEGGRPVLEQWMLHGTGRVVGREPGRILHRPARAGRQPRDAEPLPGAERHGARSAELSITDPRHPP